MKIIIPMAGRGSRFRQKNLPKPLLPVAGKPMVAWTLQSIRQSLPHHNPADIICITLTEHETHYQITEQIQTLTGSKARTVSIPDITEGPVCTVLAAMHLLDEQEDFMTVDCDQYFDAPDLEKEIITAQKKKLAGLIPVWRSDNAAYSFIRTGRDGYAIETAEKKVISHKAAIGIYYFGSKSVYQRAATQMISEHIKTKNEYYMCPLYNIVMKQGGKVRTTHVKNWMTMGTPEELIAFEKYIWKKRNGK